MKKIRAKLLAGLATLCSCFLCLGVGIAVSTPAEVPTITANATTTYTTITHLTPLASSGTTFIYAYPTNESKPGVNSWDHAFSFVTGTGDGFLWNGESYEGWELKQPGDFYIGLGGKTATAGDILTIDGTFYNATADANIVFENCGLKYNGSAWESYVPPVVHNIGALNLHVNSSVGGAKGLNNTLYLQRADGNALPILSWDYFFTYESGNGFQVNGVQKTPSAIKSTGDGFYWAFDGVDADSVVSISGTFFCESQNVKYVIEDSYFKWNGTGWTVYTPATVHNIGALNLHVNSSSGAASGLNNALYLKRADGGALPFQAWENPFVLESGDGLKVNGNSVALNEMQSTGEGLYILFAGLNAGDVISISGTFFCAKQNIKYVIDESYFKWNGSGWEVYVNYATYEIGGVVIGNGSSASAVYFDKASGAAFEATDGTWSEKLTYESGIGVTLNGAQISMDDIKIPNNLYVGLGTTATAGDVLAIGGTFYNDNLAVKYVVEDSMFQWNGSAWVEYVATAVYEIGALELHVNSSTGGQSGNNAALYLQRADGSALPFMGWENPFVLESGDGLKVNGNSVTLQEMQSTSDGLFIKFDALSAGDEISISGTFFCEKQNIKYVITESKFVWNGSGWEKYVAYSTYEVGKVLMTNSSNATAGYFYRADEVAFEKTDATWAEKLTFLAGSGIGITINGVAINMTDIKIPGDIYVGFGTTAKTGDVLAIGGTFYNVNLTVKYVITNSYFEFNGTKWISICDESELLAYDTVTILDLGVGTQLNLNGTADYSGLSYVSSTENTTGSVKFRFGYQSTDLGQGDFALRLRGEAWSGFHFRLIWNGIDDADMLGMGLIALNNNQYYTIEIGAIDTTDGENIFIYVKIDDAIQFATKVAKETYASYNTNHVSIYANNVATSTMSDPDNIAVTYTSSIGTFTQYAEKNGEYALSIAKSYNAFIGWMANGTLYEAGETIAVGTENLAFEALEIDFAMDDGAAIRLANTADESGIRFTSRVNKTELEALLGVCGITDYDYGTLIVPYDYLSAGQAPNLTDFVAGESIQQIPCTYSEEEDGNLVYRGAMKKLNTGNYDRLFAGRGYLTITLNDSTKTVYTPFDIDVHVRSVRYVAQGLQADTEEYDALTAEKKTVVDTYAAADQIKLLNYGAYAANNNLNVIAWYYPELDSSNNYENATNDAIAQKMKDAGIKAVYLDGMHHLDLNTHENIEKTRQIIEFFWSQGLYTIAFGSNASTNCHIDYSAKDFPDFSACEGFMGYLVWDEPSGDENIEKLAEFARNFETVYGGTDVTFMANLLPSYASLFNGTTSWWESSVDSLKKDAYKAYLQQYCDTVLSQIKGEKWLSLDTYPINADYSLTANFLFDLAMLKYYAENNDAHAHVALQSSGWTEDGNSSKNRMPTEAEMRMQAYAAMAFGIDSISWWSYSDKREDNQLNPTDSDEYYTRFANVNNELAAISAVYGAFDWKGVILGAGTDNGNIFNEDSDYEAYNLVNGQIGAYQLTAASTKNLSAVSTNKTSWNYLMGVMQDMNGNEGYMLCNYNSHEEDRAQTITLTFETNVTEVVIYRGGVAQTVSVSNGKLAVSLATGEGVFIIPSKLG